MSENNFFTSTFPKIGSYLSSIFKKPLSVINRNWWNNIFLGRRQTVLVDVNNLIEVYSSCPQLKTVIDRNAEYVSMGRLEIIDDFGDFPEVYPDHPYLIQLKTPNPISKSTNKFVKEFYILRGIYGKSFVYKNQPVSWGPPKFLWNLSPQFMKIHLTGKLYDQIDISGIIEKFQTVIAGNYTDYQISQVEYSTDGVSLNPLLPDSKLISLQLPISNIIGLLKMLNIFVYHGPKLIISSDNKDSAGSLPFQPAEQKLVREQMNRNTDLSNDVSVYSATPLQITKADYPIKEILAMEQLQKYELDIIDAYGHDKVLYSNAKDATYENKEKGLRNTIQNSIMPQSEILAGMLTNIFQLGSEKKKFRFNYDHLPSMQEDKLMEANFSLAQGQLAILLFEGNLISAEAACELLDMEFTGTGEVSNHGNPILPNEPKGKKLRKTSLQLTSKLSDLLKTIPETGMGYHYVEVIKQDGKSFGNRIVLNSEWLILQPNDNLKIEDIYTLMKPE